MKTSAIPSDNYLGMPLEQDIFIAHWQTTAQQIYFEGFKGVNPSKYLILSANDYSNMELFDIAARIQADEIILPYVLCNWSDSFVATAKALEDYNQYSDTHNFQNTPKFMLVPNGETIYRWGICLERILELYTKLYTDMPIIGIPAQYAKLFLGGRLNLVERYILPLKKDFDLEIHLLGWSSEAGILKELAKYARSISSTKPFLAAMYDLPLDYSSEAKLDIIPARDVDYFGYQVKDHNLLLNNLRGFRRAGVDVEWRNYFSSLGNNESTEQAWLNL